MVSVEEKSFVFMKMKSILKVRLFSWERNLRFYFDEKAHSYRE